MSTDLTTVQDGFLIPQSLVAQPKFGDDAVLERMSGSGFLPRIQLMTSTNRPVARGVTKMGNYCLIKGKDTIVHDFGDVFSALIITWRPKAIDFSGPKAKVFYNPSKDGFKNTEAQANKKIKKFMYGPEYLVYLPDIQQIACFHFNNLTMRMRAGEMRGLLGKAGTFKSEIIENDGNTWPAPLVSLCTTPLQLPEPGTAESQALFLMLGEAAGKFAAPPDEEVEEVNEEAEATTTAADARPR